MKHAFLLGDRSDIAKALVPYLGADGWTVQGWNRDTALIATERLYWDLMLCCLGGVYPVGNWWDQNDSDVLECFRSNLLTPLKWVRKLWPYRNPGASVCFMAGSNPNSIMSGYAAYNASKMSLLKLVEQMDYESENEKIFALGPGYVKTKIHKATLDANWPNERIARGDDGTPIERIWGCLKWCIEQPKEVVGGRNITASDPWDTSMDLEESLRRDPNKFKLRRIE